MRRYLIAWPILFMTLLAVDYSLARANWVD